MLQYVYSIVEGRGDVAATPVLLRRFAYQVHQNFQVFLFTPHRLSRGQMVAGSYLENAVELGARKLRARDGTGAIFVLLDADDDCPAQLGPQLLGRVTRARPDIPASVVVVKKEYEAWFLASAVSLRGVRGILPGATPPPDPESIRGAKQFLEREMMLPSASYSETIDQPALTEMFDFDAARACPSFDKLWRDLDRLFAL